MAGPIPILQTTRRRFTNEGIPLTSEWLGGESDTIREIPPEWRAALELVAIEQPVPTDRELFQLSDEVLACKAEQKQTSERTMRTIRKPAGVFTLLERFTNKDKEFGTRTRTFHFQDDYGSVPTPTATTEVNTKNFGNKHFEQIIEQIPGVFDAEEFTVERPVVTPEDFRALLQEHEHAITEEGDAEEPTLIDGDIKRTDTQQDVFLHRESRRYIDTEDLPETITNYKTNQFKQLVIAARELRVDDNDPYLPSALFDTKYTVLGDGTALAEVEAIEEVFTQQAYEETRPEVWPERFRALIPLSTDRHRVAGTASQPTLGTGDVHKSEKQEDDFIKLVETSIRDLPSLPTASLFGQEYEDTFDLLIPYSEYVDTAGAHLGDPRTIVTPQGDGTDHVKVLNFSSIAAALDAYNLVFPGTTNLNNKLPDILSDLESVFEVNSGNGTYSETGSGYWSIRGSYSLSIRGSGNGSAAVVADAIFLLTPAFKPAAKTKRVVFFLPSPVSSGAILTKLTTILGVTVSDWPDFAPTPVTVTCTSRKVSVRAEANQHTQSGGSGIGDDPCDTPDCIACDAASTTGTGTSTEVGITIKTIRIPACLHDGITLHDTQDEDATAQAYAFDGSSFGDCVPPEFGPADTGVITLTATGAVDCDADSTGDTSYPTGTYLLDTSAQPYKYGYAIIHAEVVDL